MNSHPIQKYLKCFKSYFLFFFVISLLIVPSLEGFSQAVSEGKASWIGERFQGKKTSSGELFDMNDLTASHATLPYGSKVKVTSKKTGKSVVVRVNNRSEIDNGRLIDLSKRAAEQIGLIEEGVGLVKVETVSQASAPKVADSKSSSLNIKTSATPASTTPVASKYVIQYASFFDLDNAVEFRDALKKKELESNIEVGKGNDGRTVYRVNSIGQYNSRIEAKNALSAISPQEGIIVPLIVSGESVPKVATAQPSSANTAKPTTASPVNKASATSTNAPKTYEFGIQFGAFGTQLNAKDMQNKLLVEKGIKTIIHQFPDDDKKLYRVLTNRAFSSRAEADSFLQQNSTQGVILTFVK